MDNNIYQLIAIKSPAANEIVSKILRNWSQWEKVVETSGMLKHWRRVNPSYTKEKCSAQIFFDAVFLLGTLELEPSDFYVTRYMSKYTDMDKYHDSREPIEFMYLNNWINSL